MKEKLWRFDILVNDCLMNFNLREPKIYPESNDYLLSVVNGFEDEHWMKKNFQDFIFNNIAQTALNAEERIKCIDDSYTALTEAAKHLRLIEDKGQGSEIAEIVLYGIMKHHYKAISVTPKIFYKQNDNDNAKGADAVHIVLTNDGNFQLWLGEAKFYNSIEDVRFAEPLNSVKQMLGTSIIRKEMSVMTSLHELDNQIKDIQLVKNIKEALRGDVSIDEIKPHIHVPILLLHECEITAKAKRLDELYIQQIKEFHKERAISFFRKQISKLGNIANYDSIQFHLILFPIPKKKDVVDWFINRAKILKQDGEC